MLTCASRPRGRAPSSCAPRSVPLPPPRPTPPYLPRHPPWSPAPRAGRAAESLGRRYELRERVASVYGHKDVAQLIARRVQRDGEGERHSLQRQPVYPRRQTGGRDRDAPGAESEAGGIRDPPHRLQDRRIVGERLAHAHEDDVREPASFGGQLLAKIGRASCRERETG